MFRIPLLTLLLVPIVTTANSPSPWEDFIPTLLEQKSEVICEKYKALPLLSCQALVKAAGMSVANMDVDDEALKSDMAKGFSNPEYLNTALYNAFGETVPLGLKFKFFDVEDSDSVVGLTFDINYGLKKTQLVPKNGWNRSYRADFKASGTVTQDAYKNPFNFIEASFNFSGNLYTDIPNMDDEYARMLGDFAFQAAQCADLTAENCPANAKGQALLDSTVQFLNSYQSYHVGFDLGYEAEQNFEAKQSRVRVYAFAQYEDWGDSGWLGAIDLTPSIRLGVDSINPNKETPRAIAGDDSSFYRLSGEASIWMPVAEYSGEQIVFTFSYRYYKELNPSEIVEEAGLDTYQIKTYGLTGSNGLFVTYVSGRLPFDQKSNNVIELGWQTHF